MAYLGLDGRIILHKILKIRLGVQGLNRSGLGQGQGPRHQERGNIFKGFFNCRECLDLLWNS
jgi:hypothetical protein